MKNIKITKETSLNLRSGQIKIYVDDKFIKSFSNTTTDLQVSNGHKIQAKIQFCSSNKLEISESIQSIEVKSYMTDKVFIVILFSVLSFTLVALLTDYKIFGVLPFIICLYPLYFITIGRNKYLQLRVKENGN